MMPDTLHSDVSSDESKKGNGVTNGKVDCGHSVPFTWNELL